MGEYSKEDFLRGLRTVGVTSLQQLKERLPMLRAEMDSPDMFAKIYNYTYSFACERDKKNLNFDSALVLWKILFTGKNSWKFTNDWIEYLESLQPRPLVMLQDTWKLLLDFKRVRSLTHSSYEQL